MNPRIVEILFGLPIGPIESVTLVRDGKHVSTHELPKRREGDKKESK